MSSGFMLKPGGTMSTKATAIGAIVWAGGFLLSAVLLKGNPLGDWIEGALLAGWVVFVALARPGARRACPAEELHQ